jgi:protein-S-isoprenylcysteine O-methyltransferase Ste14
MSLAALMGFGILLGAAFGVRTLAHRRRTGEAAFRSPPNRAAWVGDGLFTLGVAAVMVGPILELADVVEPLDGLAWFPVQVSGAVLLAVGAGIALLAQAQMGASWRAGIDVSEHYELVRDGLFRVVRNPFYLGIIVATTGVTLMVPSAVTAIGWIAVVFGCEIDVRLVEEPHLAATKGGRYREYAAITGRFLPSVGRGLRC